MKGLLFYFIAGLIGLIVQGSILKVIIPFNAVPNLILILVVFIAFYQQSQAGALFSFILGLEYDLFGSHLLLGPSASAAVIVYALVSSFSKRLYVESPFTLGMVVLVSSFINHSVASIVASQFVQTESLVSVLIRYSPLEAIASALVAPFIFKQLLRFTGNRTLRSVS